MSEEHDEKVKELRKARFLTGLIERFYFSHTVPLIAIAFLLDITLFTKISLVYTTTVSAITAGATYGAKRKAIDAEIAGYENP